MIFFQSARAICRYLLKHFREPIRFLSAGAKQMGASRFYKHSEEIRRNTQATRRKLRAFRLEALFSVSSKSGQH